MGGALSCGFNLVRTGDAANQKSPSLLERHCWQHLANSFYRGLNSLNNQNRVLGPIILSF